MTIGQIFLGIMQGAQTTLMVTAFSIGFATPFALVFGIAQHLARGLAGALVTSTIEFWRSSPVIILLFVFYYALPLVHINLSAMMVSSLVLGLNIGGYGSQAVRAGLRSLDQGQVEAGRALGLSRAQVLHLIELPQALSRMAPTFINLIIQLLKGTALVSLVTLSDMTFRAKEIAEVEYNPVSIYAALLLAYFILCYPVTLFGRWIESRVGAGGHTHEF